jgi:hypothetical protein
MDSSPAFFIFCVFYLDQKEASAILFHCISESSFANSSRHSLCERANQQKSKWKKRERERESETLWVSSLGEEILKTNKSRMLGLPSFDGGSRGNNNKQTIKEKENNDRLFLRLKCFDCNFPKEKKTNK